MLVHKLAHVVDLVVDDDVEVLLGVVLGNILIRELLGGHLGRVLSVWKLSSSKRWMSFFFWRAVFVSTVRASRLDERRNGKQLSRGAYQKSGDLNTGSGD